MIDHLNCVDVITHLKFCSWPACLQKSFVIKKAVMKYSRFIFIHKDKIHSILKSFEDAEGSKYPCWPIISGFSMLEIFQYNSPSNILLLSSCYTWESLKDIN